MPMAGIVLKQPVGVAAVVGRRDGKPQNTMLPRRNPALLQGTERFFELLVVHDPRGRECLRINDQIGSPIEVLRVVELRSRRNGPDRSVGRSTGRQQQAGGNHRSEFQWIPPPPNCLTRSLNTAFASPNNIHVLSSMYSSLSMPAKPGFLLRFTARTVFALSASMMGMP